MESIKTIAWRLNDPLNEHFRTIDVWCPSQDKVADNSLSSRQGSKSNVHYISLNDLTQSKPQNLARSFILKHLLPSKEVPVSSTNGCLKLIVLSSVGFVICSNLLRRRLGKCYSIVSVHDFVSCGDKVQSLGPDDHHNFSEILQAAYGGIVHKPEGRNSVKLAEIQAQVERDIATRMPTCSLTSPSPIREKTVVMLHCRKFSATQLHFAAAADLNIKFLILDVEGHWIQDRLSEFPVVDFIPIDLSLDGLTERVLDALKQTNRQLDGILSYYEPYMRAASEAGEILGLSRYPYKALAIADDKYATRELSGGNVSYCFHGSKDLQQKLPEIEIGDYPLIVKPQKGYGSFGVRKVANEAELKDAVASLEGADEAMVEPFVEGPEFDANFYMWNSEVLFFEMVDNFPVPADDASATASSSFQETDHLTPSNFTQKEQDLIQKTMGDLVLKMGFTTGVFHTEGRLRYSESRYETRDGVLDLWQCDDTSNLSNKSRQPEVFVLEVNTRTPGKISGVMSEPCSGVDWSILELLHIVNDEQRARILCKPFAQDASLSCGTVVIVSPHEGKYVGEDFCQELGSKHPELMQHIIASESNFEDGDHVPAPPDGAAPYVGHLVVMTDKGHEELVRLMKLTRSSIRLPVERTAGMSTLWLTSAFGRVVDFAWKWIKSMLFEIKLKQH